MLTVISLQNQFLPVTHVLSSLSSVQPKGVKSCSVITQSQGSNVDSNTVICAESLKTAIQNNTDVKVEVSKLNLRSLGLCPSCKLNTVENRWKRSYISASTFFENKYGFPERILRNHNSYVNNFPLFSHYLLGSFSGHQHVRTFKTVRGQNTVGLNSQTLRPSTSGNFIDKFMTLRSWREPKDKTKLMNEAEQSEKLKVILTDNNLTVNDQQKLKVAFAEGYLASDGRGRPGTKLRIFNIFRDLLGIILILAILFSFMGGSFRLQIGNNNSVHPEEINVTFDDVKGVEEAKQELQEIVEFLRSPEKFSVLGGKLPKGVLLVGPPGTGKTLLARAVAGEAAVPFFHAAGPEFDEVLVGQGARRVRDLFSTAKARAPCVIFIDEIDSVGAKRTNSVLHPYANQTINQLLSEMDGFRQNDGVIVLGATNRREDLDKALLRPGRFDVEVQVPIPDLKGRKEILELYLSKIKLASDVDVNILARGTTGFTGADIENLVNQAAIRAAVDQADAVSMKYLLNSRDKVLMGPERKSRIPDEEANFITAYHEGGHAIVAHYTKDAHPLHKVTIIPRGPSLGHTAYIPEKERYHVSKAQMLAMMDTMMGGRAAEELIFGTDKITSGASSDLKQATALATQMVKLWGMSEKVGVRTFDEDSSPLIIVNELGQSTAEAIDAEIKRILTESYERAKTILKNHSKEHKLLAEALIKYETLDAEDINALLTGKDNKCVKEEQH